MNANDGSLRRAAAGTAASCILLAALSVASPLAAVADEDFGVAAEAAVPAVIKQLKGAGDADEILQALIRVNDITENNLGGVMDDTTAKETLVQGLSEKKREAASNWRPDIDFAYGVLKRRLDPYNVVALRGYLAIAPYLGGFFYFVLLAIQQKIPGLFTPAYLASVATLVAPALFLIVNS